MYIFETPTRDMAEEILGKHRLFRLAYFYMTRMLFDLHNVEFFFYPFKTHALIIVQPCPCTCIIWYSTGKPKKLWLRKLNYKQRQNPITLKTKQKWEKRKKFSINQSTNDVLICRSFFNPWSREFMVFWTCGIPLNGAIHLWSVTYLLSLL